MNKLQKYLAKIGKGHEKELAAAGFTTDLIEVTPEQAVQIAKITNTDAAQILLFSNEAALERMSYKAPVVQTASKTQPAVARSPMVRTDKPSETGVTSWKR